MTNPAARLTRLGIHVGHVYTPENAAVAASGEPVPPLQYVAAAVALLAAEAAKGFEATTGGQLYYQGSPVPDAAVMPMLRDAERNLARAWLVAMGLAPLAMTDAHLWPQRSGPLVSGWVVPMSGETGEIPRRRIEVGGEALALLKSMVTVKAREPMPYQTVELVDVGYDWLTVSGSSPMASAQAAYDLTVRLNQWVKPRAFVATTQLLANNREFAAHLNGWPPEARDAFLKLLRPSTGAVLKYLDYIGVGRPTWLPPSRGLELVPHPDARKRRYAPKAIRATLAASRLVYRWGDPSGVTVMDVETIGQTAPLKDVVWLDDGWIRRLCPNR